MVKRNASGNFVDVEGLSGELLKWLSKCLGFTYKRLNQIIFLKMKIHTI